jgi:uroporphyrinogen-III synthase
VPLRPTKEKIRKKRQSSILSIGPATAAALATHLTKP